MARLRTFIAVALSAAVRARVAEVQDLLGRAGGDVKWVEEDNLHVTLLFLGEVDEREILGVCRAVSAASAEVPAFGLSVEGIGCFGQPERPRTLWVGVGEGREQLVELHAALETRLLALGAYRREHRKYEPHVTLGRVRSERDGDGLAEAIRRHGDWHGGDYEVREVVVMSSELRSEGPVYAVLSRAKLGPQR